MLRKVKYHSLLIVAAGFIFCALCALQQGAAFGAIIFEVDADTPVVLAGKHQNVIVRALVRPGGETIRKRIPLAVALVLDKSGSMGSDGKMENAKLGALEALRRLDAKDVATVIVYDTEASVKVPAKSVSEMNVFTKAISGIRAGGNTALYDGVSMGAKQLLPFVSDGYVPRIILLSDGLANVGPSSTWELAALGRSLAKQDMTISTIGLGLDYNEDLMTALAAESGGNAYFAKQAESLSGIFARDMLDATTLTARKVKVTLTCASGVRPISTIGRKASQKDETSIEVSIDNLYGDEKYALFEIEIPAPATEKAAALDAATLKLEYLDPATESVVVFKAPLKLTPVTDEGEIESNRRFDIISQAEIARNAEAREEAVRLADEGRSDEAAKILQTRASNARAKMAPSPMKSEIESDAQDLESLSETLIEQKNMSNETRKSVVNEAYRQKNQQVK
ncbi:MAG: VWA domain-containing protein [Synergistaceae bacterium]|nr:VWA domain-containing protein [Synergistaceae bacterium]